MDRNLKAIYSLAAPMLGTFPIIVFLIMSCFFSFPQALIGALITFILYVLVDFFIFKSTLPYTLQVSFFVFIVLVGFSFIKPFNILYEGHPSVVLELLSITGFSLFYMIRNYFKGRIIIKDKKNKDFLLARFDSDEYVIKTMIRIFTAHIMIVLCYELFPEDYHSPTKDLIIYYITLFILILFHLAAESIRLYFYKKKMGGEDWLPIVNDQGTVQGKIAYSISKKSGNKYMHPIIRIALISKGKIYLSERPSFYLSQPSLMDYPFEYYLKFGESLDEGVKKAFNLNGEEEPLPTHFLFKYIYKNIETNRLVYLYTCTLTDEAQAKELNLPAGKFWTGKQIQENLGTGLFSEYFEKEYDFLENTVLMADRLMNNLIELDHEKE